MRPQGRKQGGGACASASEYKNVSKLDTGRSELWHCLTR
nr:MAG TPA: hypothetical protein [Caudoviricetes sp.]